VRSNGARPAKVSRGESRGFGRWLLGSGLYSLTLGYGTPRSFFAVAPDTWPGDPAVGQRLIAGELLARGSAGAVIPESEDPPWQRASAPALWLDALNGFGWLRDLRDCGDPSAAGFAARLVDDWTNHEGRWSATSWRREVLAERVVSWIRHYDWLASAAAEGSPQSRRSRSQAKPFSASTHRVGSPARRHGGSSDTGATAPALPRARSSPRIRRWPTAGSPGQLSGATAKKERGEA
jgi:uncharacterized heparinase superfamily protein